MSNLTVVFEKRQDGGRGYFDMPRQSSRDFVSKLRKRLEQKKREAHRPGELSTNWHDDYETESCGNRCLLKSQRCKKMYTCKRRNGLIECHKKGLAECHKRYAERAASN